MFYNVEKIFWRIPRRKYDGRGSRMAGWAHRTRTYRHGARHFVMLESRRRYYLIGAVRFTTGLRSETGVGFRTSRLGPSRWSGPRLRPGLRSGLQPGLGPECTALSLQQQSVLLGAARFTTERASLIWRITLICCSDLTKNAPNSLESRPTRRKWLRKTETILTWKTITHVIDTSGTRILVRCKNVQPAAWLRLFILKEATTMLDLKMQDWKM